MKPGDALNIHRIKDRMARKEATAKVKEVLYINEMYLVRYSLVEE
jgi:hypothetical protein